MREIPLLYDGSGRHPRYHFNDPPFTNRLLWLIVLIIALPITPIIYIVSKCKHEKIY